ncbi:MAG: MBL fold metallo-hydrolase [Methanotrichaceae archaeon]|nr:MBL fold metallo-hydrolase [Methanotrichaceae archaeon]
MEGTEALRRINGRGRSTPHLSLGFDSHLFSIDTSRSPNASLQPDAYLITHAHSDHHGKSAMLSPFAIASAETARALEIRYGRKYKGQTFDVGDNIQIKNVKVQTFPTGHTIGSSAFYWETELGVRVLITGDVKDYCALPRCDLLVMEANYGDPWDPSCCFEDDLASFFEATESGASFGAYVFGKAQRAVGLIRAMGYKGIIGMDTQSLALTRELMQNSAPLAEVGDANTNVVSPWNLGRIPGSNKFVLTGREDMPYPAIKLSDHLDFRGLMRMVEHTSPHEILIYHPEGKRASLLANYLRQCGMEANSLSEIRGFIL